MWKVRVILLKSHLRSTVKAVRKTSFLCACSNALPRNNRHTIIYPLALTCTDWVALNSFFNIMGKKTGKSERIHP